MPTIWCDGELGSFPEAEFRQDLKGQVAIPHIHERGKPHFTNGTPVQPVIDLAGLRKLQQLQGDLDNLLLKESTEPAASEIQGMVWELHRLAMGLPAKQLRKLIGEVNDYYHSLIDRDQEGPSR